MEKVEWADVQRLVLSGYPHLQFSTYLFWHFLPGDVHVAKRWLGDLAERLTCATERGDKQAIHVAITAHGLKSLQISAGALDSFSVEFLEGMAPRPTAAGLARRSSILGDSGDSSPEFWEWGGWTKEREIDGMLLLYAPDKPSLDALIVSEINAMAGAAEPALKRDGKRLIIDGRVYDDRKEHFGFKDGISQPVIDGSPKANRKGKRWWRNDVSDDGKELTPEEKRIHIVKPGEFVLGYKNERRASITDVYPAESKARATQDIRRNGTYLVFRQLEQDVPAFNDFVTQSARLVYGRDDDAAKEDIAARLVGRTREGHPLGPMNGSRGETPRNDFLYYFEDRFGMACPIGAHIRRANPRDTIGPDADTALRLSKMHRIIRRGRPYGERVDAPDAKPADRHGPRGISFIALNADIAGQFEMIQHSWLNNTHFGGLHAGADSLGHLSCPGDVVAIQDRPVNRYVDRPRPFVRVRGGAYFFLPGIEAVRALAS